MILDQIRRQKIKFDVTNLDHLAKFSYFMKHNAWGREGCPFELEFPYQEIPYMIKDKLVRNMVGAPQLIGH